ncbi:MAG: hypothetical protein KAG66_24045, partial [Methylococcales bacterium]|nr:hypothetical protein [Methylococcales bacterium]
NTQDLGFAGGTLDSGLRLGGWGSATDILTKESGVGWVHATGSPGAAPFQGEPVDFLITDDGTNVSILYTLVSDPAQTTLVSVTTALSAQTSNHIGFGGTGQIELDNLVVTQIPEPATLGMVAIYGGSILFIRRKLMF